ncbi:MAG: beta-lactamase family protein [Saprospiraceae bacterium]|nr:beta-lactamase family protein [Saprospiraceae bacterium]
MIQRIIVVLLCLLSMTLAYGQSWQDTVALIENAMSRYLAENPGCQLSIQRHSQLIFSKAWGMADLEHQAALTPASVIEAGSVSKQFTAAALLLLEQQGRLSLNDDVRKYVPELPDYGHVIRLQHLVHHTSGLRDWGAVAAVSGWPRTTKTYTNDDALDIMAMQQSLNNKPGDEFIYSNSNYNLMAIIVDRVSGLSLAEFTRQYIFEPAGMTHTQWRDNFKRIVPGRAMAYAYGTEGYETDMPNEYVYGNGGLLTTTEDLLRWMSYCSEGKLGKPSLWEKQIMILPFNNGAANNYAAGLFIQKFKGWSCITHSGATASYRANLELFPELGLSIAVLSNTSRYDSSAVNVAASIRSLMVKAKDDYNAPAPNKAIASPDRENLATYAGWYKNTRDGSSVKVDLTEAGLTYKTRPLLALTETRFAFPIGPMLVEMQGGKEILLINPALDTQRLLRVEAAVENAPENEFYEGRYYSAETGSYLTIYRKDNSWRLKLKKDMDFPLKPTCKDGFTMDEFGGDLNFMVNPGSRKSKLSISVSRARNVLFEKVE